jgi:hypothetical protein
VNRQIGDVVALEQDAPGIGFATPVRLITGGLAGAVGADQAWRKPAHLQRKIAATFEAAELFPVPWFPAPSS